MIKAYLILAHTDPNQLFRLVQALDDEHSSFYIHIDKASNMEDFELLSKFGRKLVFVERVKAEWARFGLVQATLNGLNAIHQSGIGYRQVHLLSGQDYPIKSNEYITRFAEENAEKIFMEFHHLPAHEKWQPHGGLYRVDKYFFGFSLWNKFLSKSINLLSGKITRLQRKIYNDLEPYAGSMWWTFSQPAVEYIIDFIESHPGYVDFHQHTFAPDEVFFQTILLNASDEKISRNLVNNNKRLIKWKDKYSSHPDTISIEHLPEIVNTDQLFARKFTGMSASEILELIDRHRYTTQIYEALL